MKTATLFVLGFMGGSAYCADLDPRQIVASSIFNYQKDWTAALQYTYTEHDVTKDDSPTRETVEISQISELGGTPYSRLIGKNGHPLSAEEARREEEKYRKVQSARDAETPDQRERRLRKYREQRAFLHEVPDAFNIKMLGRETIAGRPNYVIQLTPNPNYVPKSRNARMFADIAGKLWIDVDDLRWSKAEADVIDTISIGWFLARIGPGAHITLTQFKIDDEHWMLKEITVKGLAKIMLVKNRSLDETVSCSDYRRVRSTAGTPAAKNH
ncbi:MAG TPA: hypothetical protein VGL72_27890 [Bryobacteraceae bacterium]|jgi:hypothetical protein